MSAEGRPESRPDLLTVELLGGFRVAVRGHDIPASRGVAGSPRL